MNQIESKMSRATCSNCRHGITENGWSHCIDTDKKRECFRVGGKFIKKDANILDVMKRLAHEKRL